MSPRAMSASEPKAPTTQLEVDEALHELGNRAQEFAQLSAQDKAGLLRECIPRLLETAPTWVAAGCKAKGLSTAQSGEEWLVGPMPTIRMARLLAESLDMIDKRGRPRLGTSTAKGPDGRLRVNAFPHSGIDRALYNGFSGYVLMQEGIDRARAEEQQASFYQNGAITSGVSVVLGAGNVSSIPPMDVFTKMFIEGKVVVLKMNPVNEWVGPSLERGLSPLISRGYLRIVYGDGLVGGYLVGCAGIADVHITGSDRTHDLIVWGPEGPERDRRMRDDEPLLTVPICSELGNVSPVAIVPYDYSASELQFQARNVATMVANNGSFNCNAAKILITSKKWGQRDRFLKLLRECLETIPTRNAYYPGAFERYESLVGGRDDVICIGEADDKRLPWTLIQNVDSSNPDEPLFRIEPFCSILSETTVGSADPVEFLHGVATFMNERLWGTLNATIIIAPSLEKDASVSKALDQTILKLRYGTVSINHWPGLCYGMTTMPWGGHPSSTLKDIQSGLGWVHNTYMLEGIDKSVVRGDIKIWPDPPWFSDHNKATKIGPRLVAMEANPGWRRVPGIALRSIF